MRILRIETSDDPPLVVRFHRQVSVVQGLTADRRSRLIAAVGGVVAGTVDGITGSIEAAGVELEIDQATADLLELRSAVDIVLRADQLPERGRAAQDPMVHLERLRSRRRELAGRRAELRRDTLLGAASEGEDCEAHALPPADARRPPVPAPPVADAAGEDPVPPIAPAAPAGRAPEGALVLALRWERVEAQLAVATPKPARGRDRSPADRPASAIQAEPPNSGVRTDGDDDAGAEPATQEDEVRLAAARLKVDQARRALEEAEASIGLELPQRRDVAAVEAAHVDVLYFEQKAGGRFGSGRVRRRLSEARSSERAALERLGFATYAEFVVSWMRPTVLVDVASVEQKAAQDLVAAERGLAALQARTAPLTTDAEAPTIEANREELAVELSRLRQEVEEALGRPPGPFPAAELRAATMLSREEPTGPTEPARGGADDAPAADEPTEDPLVERDQRQLGLGRKEADLRVVELEIVAVDEQIADLEADARSAGAGSPATTAEGLSTVEATEWYVLARLAALRRISIAGSAPILIDDAFADLDPEDAVRLVARIGGMADAVQVMIMSDDADIATWAKSAGSERAGIVSAED